MSPYILYTKFPAIPSHAIDDIEILGRPCALPHRAPSRKKIKETPAAVHDKSPCAELISAIKLRDIEKVRTLAPIAAAEEINGQTPLVAAVREGHVDLVKAILPHCDPRKANAFGHTALMFAALQETPFMVELLLPVSDVDAASALGETALMFAAEFGYICCIEALLGSSNANLQNLTGQTALMKALAPDTMARHSWWARLSIAQLIAPRSDLNIQDEDGWTALIFSTQVLAWDVFDLLAKHTDMTLTNAYGDTAMDLIYEHNYEMGCYVEAGGLAEEFGSF